MKHHIFVAVQCGVAEVCEETVPAGIVQGLRHRCHKNPSIIYAESKLLHFNTKREAVRR